MCPECIMGCYISNYRGGADAKTLPSAVVGAQRLKHVGMDAPESAWVHTSCWCPVCLQTLDSFPAMVSAVGLSCDRHAMPLIWALMDEVYSPSKTE